MGAHGPKRRKSCAATHGMGLDGVGASPEPGWSLVVWLLYACYWFGFLGFALATGERSMAVDLAKASPALAWLSVTVPTGTGTVPYCCTNREHCICIDILY